MTKTKEGVENKKSTINKIFDCYVKDRKKVIYLDSIIDYLKLLSQGNEIITEQTLFNLLDKEDKGYLSLDDFNNYIEGLNEFLTSGQSITDISEKQERLLKNFKKIFSKNNLIYRDLFDKMFDKELIDLRDLITEAEEMILRKGLDYSLEKKAIAEQILRNETNSDCTEDSIKNDSVLVNDSKLEENKESFQKKNKSKKKEKRERNNTIGAKLTKKYQGSPFKVDQKMILESQPSVIVIPHQQTISEKNSNHELSEAAQKEKDKKFVETISSLSPIKQSKHI